MNDLIRPTLYDAYHDILPLVSEPNGDASPQLSGRCGRAGLRDRATISRATGTTCRKWRQGDLLAVMTAGAYGAVQSGTYNSRPAGGGSAC